MEDTANIYKIPMFTSATTDPSSYGTTAQAIKEIIKPITGASKYIILLA